MLFHLSTDQLKSGINISTQYTVAIFFFVFLLLLFCFFFTIHQVDVAEKRPAEQCTEPVQYWNECAVR